MNRPFIGTGVGIFCLAVTVAIGVSVARADGRDSDGRDSDGRDSDKAKGEKHVAMNDLPSAVRAAAEHAISAGTLKHIEVETEDGREVYSVEARVAGTIKEFTFASDGTLIAEEDDVAFAQLPEAVRVAAEKYFGGSDGLRATREIAVGVTSFEVEGRKGAKELTVEFSPAGALLDEDDDKDSEGENRD